MLNYKSILQKKGRFISLLTLLILSLLFYGCNTATAGIIRVGMVADHAPWEEKISDSEAKGISADLLKSFSAYSGRAVKIVWLAQDDLFKAVSDKRVDCIFSTTAIVDTYKDTLLMTDPYTKSYPIMLIRKDSLIISKVDLNKETAQIAVITGTLTESFVKSEYSNAVIHSYDTRSEAAEALTTNICDAFIDDPLSIFALYSMYPDETRLNPAPLTDKFQYYTVYVSPNASTLVNDWNDFFTYARQSGQFETLTEKYVRPFQTIMDQYNIDIIL